MKKFLALILAVLMLASLAIASVSAEEETIDMSEFFYEFGYRNIYLGDPVEAPPVLDGEITDGEYTVTRTTEQGSRHLTGQHESDFVEYFAYDDEWIYLAFTMKQTTLSEWEHALEVRLEGPVYTVAELCDGETKPFFQRNVSWSELKPDGTIELKSSDPSPLGDYEGAVWDEDVFMAWGRNEETLYNTVEYKYSRTYMAEALEMEVEDVNWFCYFHVCGWFDAANAWTQLYYTFSPEEKLALIDAGVTYNLNWTYQTIYLCEAPEGYGETQATTTEVTTTAPTTTTAKPATTTAATTTAAATTTKAPAATTTAAAEEEGGCGSTLAISALAMIPTLAGGVILTSKKRKED